MKELFLTHEEASIHNKTLEISGPTPGVFPLALSRKKLVPTISYNKVTVRQSINSIPNTSRVNTILNDPLATESSIEFDKSLMHFPRIDSAEGSLEGKRRFRLVPIDEDSIQVVDDTISNSINDISKFRTNNNSPTSIKRMQNSHIKH